MKILNNSTNTCPWVKIMSIVFFVALAFLSCNDKKKVIGKPRPNIIFLFTDDQRWDALGAMGNPIIKTPNLDAMAKDGLLFKNAYVTTAICCVSRASVLSGQYESRHGIHDFNTSFEKEALKETYPMLLKNEGYKIGFIGKYGVGDPKDQPKDKFDFWAGTNKHQPVYEHMDQHGNYVHYTDLVGQNINTFLSETDDRPFCLSVSFKAPHVQDGDERQFIANPRYREYYKDIEIPEPETADSKYWESFPDFFRTDQNIGRERWNLRFDTPEKYQESVKNYYRLITGVDDVVGNMVKTLKEQGLDKNTFILFMGDNGMFLGEHGLAGKWYGYEESIRVPLIIYAPKDTQEMKGEIIDEIALNIDIGPTILGLAGIVQPDNMQGLDLVKSIRGKSKTRSAFFYEHTFLGSPKIPMVEGVVSPQLKYMNYMEHGYEELFDLEKDPQEKNNLATDSKYRDVLNKQRVLYQQLREKAK